jgi:hypothetical protein
MSHAEFAGYILHNERSLILHIFLDEDTIVIASDAEKEQFLAQNLSKVSKDQLLQKQP